MFSVANEIARLRGGSPIRICRDNSNPYCVVAEEESSVRAAYCFGIPVYNTHTRRPAVLRFQAAEPGTAWFEGSACRCRVSCGIHLSDRFGSCTLGILTDGMQVSDGAVTVGRVTVYPTFSGVVICAGTDGDPYEFMLKTDLPGLFTRSNKRCFSLMRKKLVPFVTLSALWAEDCGGSICPAMLSQSAVSSSEYLISLNDPRGVPGRLWLEIGLHQTKLLQDTTVESRSPRENNAFGSMAFPGRTAELGTQWIYTRPDISLLPELEGRKILKARMYIYEFKNSNTELESCEVNSRFCSFGSTWKNKRSAKDEHRLLFRHNGYLVADISDYITDRHTGSIKQTGGFIIRPSDSTAQGFCVLPTGDNSFRPVILEIKYI